FKKHLHYAPRLRNHRATLFHLFSGHRDGAPSGFGHRDSTEATCVQPSSLNSPAASTPCRASPTIAPPNSQQERRRSAVACGFFRRRRNFLVHLRRLVILTSTPPVWNFPIFDKLLK
ncbi:hypothetical protein S83_034410, partial [Arachis hypogaea]